MDKVDSVIKELRQLQSTRPCTDEQIAVANLIADAVQWTPKISVLGFFNLGRNLFPTVCPHWRSRSAQKPT